MLIRSMQVLTVLRHTFELATFFCDADACLQKSAAKNINGRLQRDLSSKTNIDQLSDQKL
jgi:IS30 family transposase